MENRKPEDVTPDLSSIDFAAAHASLSHAIALEPALWRAHFYLGRIYRANSEAKRAAEELGLASATNPRHDDIYIALAELYRRWQYTDAAIKVASQGVANAAGSATLWDALGLAYVDRGADDQAIDAFTKALDKAPADPQALFERGNAYLRSHDTARARQDFEKFLTVGRDGGQRAEVRQRLAKIAPR